jgi:hypothetical protein
VVVGGSFVEGVVLVAGGMLLRTRVVCVRGWICLEEVYGRDT